MGEGAARAGGHGHFCTKPPSNSPTAKATPRSPSLVVRPMYAEATSTSSRHAPLPLPPTDQPLTTATVLPDSPDEPETDARAPGDGQLLPVFLLTCAGGGAIPANFTFRPFKAAGLQLTLLSPAGSVQKTPSGLARLLSRYFASLCPSVSVFLAPSASLGSFRLCGLHQILETGNQSVLVRQERRPLEPHPSSYLGRNGDALSRASGN